MSDGSAQHDPAVNDVPETGEGVAVLGPDHTRQLAAAANRHCVDESVPPSRKMRPRQVWSKVLLSPYNCCLGPTPD